MSLSLQNDMFRQDVLVSIPFKREGTVRHLGNSSVITPGCTVSIPFKREGTVRP